MTIQLDPVGAETEAIHQFVNFEEQDILEVGCGDGRLTARYAHAAASVVALDSDADAVASAIAKAVDQQLYSRNGPVDFQVADITTFDLKPNSYDLALFSWSL